MSALILPATAQYNAERDRLAARHGALRYFDAQLKELDPNLGLVKAAEVTDAPGLIPGYWHVRRTDPVTRWQSYIPIKGPQGEFMEPHSGVIEGLRRNDMQRPGAWEDYLRRLDREEADSVAGVAKQKAETQEEFLARYLNKTRPSVSFARVGHWKNRAYARTAA